MLRRGCDAQGALLRIRHALSTAHGCLPTSSTGSCCLHQQRGIHRPTTAPSTEQAPPRHAAAAAESSTPPCSAGAEAPPATAAAAAVNQQEGTQTSSSSSSSSHGWRATFHPTSPAHQALFYGNIPSCWFTPSEMRYIAAHPALPDILQLYPLAARFPPMRPHLVYDDRPGRSCPQAATRSAITQRYRPSKALTPRQQYNLAAAVHHYGWAPAALGRRPASKPASHFGGLGGQRRKQAVAAAGRCRSCHAKAGGYVPADGQADAVCEAHSSEGQGASTSSSSSGGSSGSCHAQQDLASQGIYLVRRPGMAAAGAAGPGGQITPNNPLVANSSSSGMANSSSSSGSQADGTPSSSSSSSKGAAPQGSVAFVVMVSSDGPQDMATSPSAAAAAAAAAATAAAGGGGGVSCSTSPSGFAALHPPFPFGGCSSGSSSGSSKGPGEGGSRQRQASRHCLACGQQLRGRRLGPETRAGRAAAALWYQRYLAKNSRGYGGWPAQAVAAAEGGAAAAEAGAASCTAAAAAGGGDDAGFTSTGDNGLVGEVHSNGSNLAAGTVHETTTSTTTTVSSINTSSSSSSSSSGVREPFGELMDDIMPLVVRMMESSARRPTPEQLMQEAAEDSSSEMEDDVTVVEFLGSDGDEEEEEQGGVVSGGGSGAWWHSGGERRSGAWGSSRRGMGQWAQEHEVGVYATQRGVLYGFWSRAWMG